jgi:hypothetical protein
VAENATCIGCGRETERGDSITPGDDTWFEVFPPFELLMRLGVEDVYCCSLDCVAGFVKKTREPYEEMEADLINNPHHMRGA